jgi:M6 family metalloprotease-like protein
MRLISLLLRISLICFVLFLRLSSLTVDDILHPSRESIAGAKTFNSVGIVWPRNILPLHTLVVFTKFKGESPHQTLAPSWAKDLFNGQYGSVNDYFNQVSFGKYIVTGNYLPKMYELPNEISYYEHYDIYCKDVVQLLDEDSSVNLADYDNDGPDGIANSGDDDGFVDYLILVPMSRPYDFILQYATGVMWLSLKTYETHHLSANGDHVKIDSFSGCIATAAGKFQAIGTIVAEISHAFGTVDLMDKDFNTPENDSAGVGAWDVLGHGAIGWNGNGLPVGPCAYNRMLMNCIGVNNSNLIDLHGSLQGVRIKDAGSPESQVFRIWLTQNEYFLIEYRKKDGRFFYDNQIPKSGILIWHIFEQGTNDNEDLKLCDLECADGLYLDCGYPWGCFPDPKKGKDNLDFWTHDNALAYNGNLGDSTDVFDGVKFTSFGPDTNPNTDTALSKSRTGIKIYNIHQSGNEMEFDCQASPFPFTQPVSAPLIGLAFQRSSIKNFDPSLQFKKNTYLVNFGLSPAPEILIVMNGDSLKIQDVTSLNTYQTEKMIYDLLIENSNEIIGASIHKSNISLENFEKILKAYGLNANDLMKGYKPKWIQTVNIKIESNIHPFILSVGQNFPNPFNSYTSIPFEQSVSGRIILQIYNILGQKIIEKDEGILNEGYHSLSFRSDTLPSGLYFYRIHGSDLSLTRKFMVLR